MASASTLIIPLKMHSAEPAQRCWVNVEPGWEFPILNFGIAQNNVQSQISSRSSFVSFVEMKQRFQTIPFTHKSSACTNCSRTDPKLDAIPANFSLSLSPFLSPPGWIGTSHQILVLLVAPAGEPRKARHVQPRMRSKEIRLACRRERCDGSESASPTAASENSGHGSPGMLKTRSSLDLWM